MFRIRLLKRPLIALLATVAFVGGTAVLRAQQPAAGQGQGGGPPQVAARPGPTAAERYKNIEVLKDVPADDIIPVMHFIEASTGHKCLDCHVQEPTGQFSFDKDDKRPKVTAREMIKIVKTVNDEFFRGQVTVTCATCHKGARPVGQPPFAEMLTPEQVAAMAAMAARAGAPGPAAGRAGPPPAGGAPAAGGAGAQGGGGRGPGQPNVNIDEVLGKYVTALGGRPALEKVQSLALSGTLTNRENQDLKLTIEEKSPNRYRETVGPATRGFDGKSGWMQAGPAASDLSGYRLEMALRISDLGLPLAIKDRYVGLRGARAPQINGKDVIAMSGSPMPGVLETLSFDPTSGLLLRRAIQTRSPVGSMPEEIDYSDYRDVAGVKLPFQIKRMAWDTLDTLKIVDVKPNAQIDDARFMKPKN